MHTETLYMVRCLSAIHYDRRPISALSRDEIIDAYLAELDPQRLFLLQADVDEIRARYNLTLDIFLNSGSVKPAFAIYEIFRRRAGERLDGVEELLSHPMNLGDVELYEPERKDVPWPRTAEEARELWRHRLEFEFLNEILGEEGGGEAQAQEHLRKRYARLRETVDGVEPSFVQELFLNSVSRLYDPHSSFLSADTLEDFQTEMTNSLVGIGVVLQEDEGQCKVVEVCGGSPAERSGQLQVGDRILAVQQEGQEPLEILGMRLNRIVKLIRGAKGTAVTLHVRPADGDPSDRKIIPLIRDEIQFTAQRARARVYAVPDGSGKSMPLGYLRLPVFYGARDGDCGSDSCADVRELLHKLSERDIRGLVIDLRGNSGGLLDEAIALAGLFLPAGVPVVQVRDGDGQVQVFSDPTPGITYAGPLVVLTSRLSISASEILAGALQSQRRALVIGDASTYGKGSVQAILPMGQSFLYVKNGPPLGAARITFQKWYLPNGDSIQRRGVAADIALPSPNDALPIGESEERHALAWDSIAAAAWSWEGSGFTPPLTAELIGELRGRSEERRGTDEWELLRERLEHFSKRVRQKQFSLERETRQRQRDEDRAQKEEWERRIRGLAGEDYPFEEVRLDLVEQRGSGRHADGDGDGLPEWDVALRECLRVLVDWNGLTGPGAPDRGEAAHGSESERGAAGPNSGGN
jgi:carboxyl-terminal processing protease